MFTMYTGCIFAPLYPLPSHVNTSRNRRLRHAQLYITFVCACSGALENPKAFSVYKPLIMLMTLHTPMQAHFSIDHSDKDQK